MAVDILSPHVLGATPLPFLPPIPPPPHLRALTQMKIRLKGAQKGHSLLKKKADALTLKFRQILGRIIEVARVIVTIVV